MTIAFFMILLFATEDTATAQLVKLKALPLSDVSFSSVDRLGNFYFVSSSGTLLKYDPDGMLIGETSKSIQPLTLIEPWNPLKIFLYDNKSKRIRHLDHHLEEIERFKLEPSLSINPRLVCPANEANKAWIFDEADYTIKRVDLGKNILEFESKIEMEEEDVSFTFMREYQNRLFLLSENGIMIFNNLGKPITTYEMEGLTFFNFMGEELCYRIEDEIILLDLYTGTKRIIAKLNDTDQVVSTIITDERLVVIYSNKVELFKLG